jgi:hypothetical protein
LIGIKKNINISLKFTVIKKKLHRNFITFFAISFLNKDLLFYDFDFKNIKRYKNMIQDRIYKYKFETKRFNMPSVTIH